MAESGLLKGQNILLRALEPEDLEILYKWENDSSIWDISETLSPISRFILKKYLENSHKDIFEQKQLRLMVQRIEDNKALGTIDLFDFDHFHKRAAVGILIAESEDRRKGFATESLQILKNYAFSHLNLKQLHCTISVSNTSSVALFESVGFKITGTRKKWNWNGEDFEDEYFLQLID